MGAAADDFFRLLLPPPRRLLLLPAALVDAAAAAASLSPLSSFPFFVSGCPVTECAWQESHSRQRSHSHSDRNTPGATS